MPATILDQPQSGTVRVSRMRLRESGVWVYLQDGRVLLLSAALGRRTWRISDPAGNITKGYPIAAREVCFLIGDAYEQAASCAQSATASLSDEYRERSDVARRAAADELEIERRRLGELYDRLAMSAQAAHGIGRHPQLARWRSERPTAPEAVPPCLSEVRHVKQLRDDAPAIVYFLLRAGVIVYIGQTTASWPGRIAQHVDEGVKQFDDVWYLEVDRASVCRAEAAFIRRFRPEYNIALNRGAPVQ